MQFEIKPLIGVGPVRFNMTRDEVHSVLGEPESKHGNRECFLSGLMVDFDEIGKVEFIELARSTKFIASFHDKDLHSLLAEDAVAWVSTFGTLKTDIPEAGYSFVFPDMQISLWRGVLPEDENDDQGRYFEAVGAAREGYFDA